MAKIIQNVVTSLLFPVYSVLPGKKTLSKTFSYFKNIFSTTMPTISTDLSQII